MLTLHSIGLPEIQKCIKYIGAAHETMTLKVDCMGKTLQDRIQYTGNKRKKKCHSIKGELLPNKGVLTDLVEIMGLH